MGIVITSIICGTVFLSILSVLVYFAAFHETRKYSDLEDAIGELQASARHAEDDLVKINNKIRFR